MLPAALDILRLKIQKDKVLMPGKGHLRHFQVRAYLATLKRLGFKVKVLNNIGFF